MRGYFGIAVYQPKTEANIGTLWRSAFNYRASFVATVGRRYKPQASDTTKAIKHLPLVHYRDIDDMIEHIPFSCPLVGVELTDEAQPVSTFWHPPSCLYLLGAEDYGLPPEILKRCHMVIKVPGAAQCLNVAVAGSIVIYDRWVKNHMSKHHEGAMEPIVHNDGFVRRQWFDSQFLNDPLLAGVQ